METGLYYLNSRYYDPETGRLLNADSYMSTGQDVVGNNMYAYCGNNPVICLDSDGTKWSTYIDGFLHATNTILVTAGYDTAAVGAFFLGMTKDKNGIYHAKFNCWQRFFGYNSSYDYMFDIGTDMDSRHISFKCSGKNYTIWAWKGDYINLGAGAELALYRGKENSCWVQRSAAVNMSMTLSYRGSKIITYSPSKKQWWITSFHPGYINVSAHDLVATFVLTLSRKMYNSLKSAAKNFDEWSFYTKGGKYYAVLKF